MKVRCPRLLTWVRILEQGVEEEAEGTDTAIQVLHVLALGSVRWQGRR